MANANEMVEQYWPDHAPHAEKYGPHSVDAQAGVLCGCGELLGWPIEDEPEGYDEPEPGPYALPRPESARGREAYDKAAAAVAAARAKATGRTDDYAAEPEVKQGAFGSYPEASGHRLRWNTAAVPEEPLDAEVVDDMAATGPAFFSPVAASKGESGWIAGPPGGSGLAEVEREVFAEKATADRGPIEFKSPVPAADGPMADEAQTYEVGDTITVGGIEFTKQAEHPSAFTPPEPSTITEQEAAEIMASPEGQAWANEGGTEPQEWSFGDPETDPDGPKPSDDYAPDEKQAAEIMAGIEDGQSTEVRPAAGSDVSTVEETGLTPGSGTPIMPTSADSMDPVGTFLPPIDPTQVYTPQDIEIAIVEILRRLSNGEAFLREQISRLHQADYAYTMRYNLKIATSKARAADQRKAEAILACKNEIYEQTEADMLVRALRDTMHNLRSQLAGFQTVARSVGVSMGAPSYRP